MGFARTPCRRELLLQGAVLIVFTFEMIMTSASFPTSFCQFKWRYDQQPSVFVIGRPYLAPLWPISKRATPADVVKQDWLRYCTMCCLDPFVPILFALFNHGLCFITVIVQGRSFSLSCDSAHPVTISKSVFGPSQSPRTSFC
jgi:hypothetical protein